MNWLMEQSPILLVILASLFTWGCTAFGASLVFFFPRLNKKLLSVLLGFASGVMIAASFWSLLNPAIERSEGLFLPSWLITASGVLSGALFLIIVDKIMSILNKKRNNPMLEEKRRNFLLVFSITLHNIPEGLAVGVAFGSLMLVHSETALLGAISIALGIGIQNFPEGASVALPLLDSNTSRGKAFFIGQLSGLVEPFAALFGTLLVILVTPILPFLLSFAAGAMIFVVVDELLQADKSLPNGQRILAIGFLVGFIIMMVLDVALS